MQTLLAKYINKNTGPVNHEQNYHKIKLTDDVPVEYPYLKYVLKA